MFLGKAIIMILSGWIAYLIIMNSSLKENVYSPVFPVIIVVIIAYYLASIFMSVFSFSAQAILHAFLLDEEVKGNRAPKSLLEFVKRCDEEDKLRKDKEEQYKLDNDKKPNNVA